MVRATFLFALLAACLGAAPAVAAPELAATEPAGWSYDLANEMMSPFCPGRTLAECPSGSADSLRAWILMQEASGRSRASVEEELLERYGDQILAAPRAEGFGIAAYAVPVVAFLLGGALVVFVLRRMTRGGDGTPPSTATALDPEMERLVDEELAR